MSFDKQVLELAAARSLSRGSVLCALMIASGQADTRRIAPVKQADCLKELGCVPGDVAASVALNNLCRCSGVNYHDDFRERHNKKCRYVRWRELIDDPLESVFD